LDSKCCSLGLAMVSRPLSRSEKMEQVRAAIWVIVMRMALTPLSTDAALMPLFSIARRVSDARRPSTAVGDLERKADPYGFERRPNCFLVRWRYFPTFLECGDNPRRDGGGLC
jgi:hypothetical protein